MADEAARHYLRDLGFLVREQAEAASAKARGTGGSESDRAFDAGRAMAYYEVTSLMRSQAESFGLPLTDLSWGDFDPDALLGSPST